ncbi:hypothetical protein X924_08010 [Petrotoga sp. 9PWA.NaAc.5.4]|nr:hypothetical protein X924_08010 [Petrotoga sp. 9PWA.NaAc.5.4]
MGLKIFFQNFSMFLSPRSMASPTTALLTPSVLNGALAHSQKVMSVDAFGLLVRQYGNGSVKLFDCDFTLVNLAGRQGYKHDVMLDTVASIQGVIRLMAIPPQIIGGFGPFIGSHECCNFVRHFNDAVGGIIIRIVIPQIDFFHLVFLRFDFWDLANRNRGRWGATAN